MDKHAKVEERHRRLAVYGARMQKGVAQGVSITEDMWIKKGGSFAALFKRQYPSLDLHYLPPGAEKQYPWLDTLAQLAADAEASTHTVLQEEAAAEAQTEAKARLESARADMAEADRLLVGQQDLCTLKRIAELQGHALKNLLHIL